MFENIVVGVMAAMIIIAGVWSWWAANHKGDANTPDENKED